VHRGRADGVQHVVERPPRSESPARRCETNMDYKWARERVAEYLELLDEHRALYAPRGVVVGAEPRLRSIADQMNRRLSTVIKIAERVEPGIVTNFYFEDGGSDWPYKTRRKVTSILLGALDDAEAIEEHVGPVGPRLSAVQLHPWILDVSRSLWDDGHRREAIQAAATQLEIQMRAKLGTASGSGRELSEAFSAAPPSPTMSRFRLPDLEPGTEDFNSAHEGAKLYGMGCFQSIRNITTHRIDQPSDDRALEMLAALSLLARWVETASVETE
jgi:Protein of unknown function (Hypoth_ymh)